jgi:hypothetical protein
MSMKLSIYLNKHYSFYQIKDVDSNSPGGIAYNFIKEFEEKCFQSPDMVLRAIKSEAVDILKHYRKLEEEASFYVVELNKVLEKGPHLGKEKLIVAKELEEKRDTLVEFVYSIEDGFGYILEFLFGHYSRAQIGFPFLNVFKDFLPRNHYLKGLLDKENEAIWNLNEELLLMSDIVEKLDHWKRKYLDHFTPLQRFVNSDGTATQIRKSPYSKSNLKEIIFNEFNCDELYSPAMIPSIVYQIHFKDGLQNPKFTYWFLKFNAKLWAEEYYFAKFLEKEKSPIAIEFAKSELRELTDLEEKATEKLLRKELDIYSTPESNSQNYSLELKRIESNYYYSRVLNNPHMMGGDSTVNIFAKHIFFKSYLKELIERFSPKAKMPRQHNEKFLNILLNVIKNLARKPVNFENEDDYRSHFYHIFGSYEGVHVSAEEISREGRTDLLLKGELGTQIIEFKVWGRNDYQNIVHQTTGYLTDFEPIGFIFMANHSKEKKIDSDYLSILEKKENGLVGLVISHTVKDSDFSYYESIHQLKLKKKRLYHFIYNSYQ